MAVTPPSTPPSPSSPVRAVTDNNLSDIFSDSPHPTPAETDIASDIPRLRSTHATAGYRDGISTSKTRSLQPGFDEGYSLGAVFGLQVGYILGALEGLWSAYNVQSEEKSRIRSLIRQARTQLVIERLVAQEYWNKDGLWTYEVAAEGEEASFREVVQQHPILRRWDEVLREEVKTAGLNLGRFEGDEWEAGRI